MSVRKSLNVAVVTLALSVSGVALATPSDAAATGIYRNCTALHGRWAHGVGRVRAHDKTSGTPVTNFFHNNRQFTMAMNHNKGLDRDKDGIACEAG